MSVFYQNLFDQIDHYLLEYMHKYMDDYILKICFQFMFLNSQNCIKKIIFIIHLRQYCVNLFRQTNENAVAICRVILATFPIGWYDHGLRIVFIHHTM